MELRHLIEVMIMSYKLVLQKACPVVIFITWHLYHICCYAMLVTHLYHICCYAMLVIHLLRSYIWAVHPKVPWLICVWTGDKHGRIAGHSFLLYESVSHLSLCNSPRPELVFTSWCTTRQPLKPFRWK